MSRKEEIMYQWIAVMSAALAALHVHVARLATNHNLTRLRG